jgi:TPR repeat protein
LKFNKLFLIFLLTPFLSSAEFIKLGSYTSANGKSSFYYEDTSVTRKEGIVSAKILYDNDYPTDDNGKSYKSITTFTNYNCTDRNYYTTASSGHSENMASGTITSQLAIKNPKINEIKPNTVAEVILNKLCSMAIPQAAPNGQVASLTENNSQKNISTLSEADIKKYKEILLNVKDREEFLKYKTLLAESGDVTSQRELGWFHINTKYPPNDYQAARKWFEIASSQGDPESTYDLGILYLYGLGVPADVSKGIKLIEISAQKSSNSQFELGVIYSADKVVPKDLNKSWAYYELAAKNGNSKALNLIGVRYFKGDGIPKNLELAKKYFLEASNKGDKNGAQNLKVVNEELRKINQTNSPKFQSCMNTCQRQLESCALQYKSAANQVCGLPNARCMDSCDAM